MEQQVFGRIARQRELGKHDEVGALRRAPARAVSRTRVALPCTSPTSRSSWARAMRRPADIDVAALRAGRREATVLRDRAALRFGAALPSTWPCASATALRFGCSLGFALAFASPRPWLRLRLRLGLRAHRGRTRLDLRRAPRAASRAPSAARPSPCPVRPALFTVRTPASSSAGTCRPRCPCRPRRRRRHGPCACPAAR